MLQHLGQGQADARILELRLGLPHGCQDPAHWTITATSQGTQEQEDGIGVELESNPHSPIWEMGILSGHFHAECQFL